MKTVMILICATLMFGFIAVVSAGVWTDPFDGNELVDGWEFRDYRDEVTEFEVKDGFLQMTNPNGGWGHTTPDKPMLEREVPKSAAKNITVSGIFSTEPDKPGSYWVGIFLYSDDDLNYACFLFGGSAGDPQKTLIGSMVNANWQDKGHFDTGFDVPVHLKIVKEDDVFSGYYREDEKDEWKLSGDKTWNHKFDVERVGIGFMNNWGGQTVIFFVDTLSIEGEGIKPLAVAPEGKLATMWGTSNGKMRPRSQSDGRLKAHRFIQNVCQFNLADIPSKLRLLQAINIGTDIAYYSTYSTLGGRNHNEPTTVPPLFMCWNLSTIFNKPFYCSRRITAFDVRRKH